MKHHKLGGLRQQKSEPPYAVEVLKRQEEKKERKKETNKQTNTKS